MVWLPVAAGVYVTEQLALAGRAGASVPGIPANPPPPLAGKLTCPLGGVGAPGSLSVTVAVHVVGLLPGTRLGEQFVVVVVGWAWIATVVVPLLAEWVASPP